MWYLQKSVNPPPNTAVHVIRYLQAIQTFHQQYFHITLPNEAKLKVPLRPEKQ